MLKLFEVIALIYQERKQKNWRSGCEESLGLKLEANSDGWFASNKYKHTKGQNV